MIQVESKFLNLYKDAGKHKDVEMEKQQIRREQLLEEQKNLRAAQHDDFRNLDEFIAKLRKKKHYRNPQRRKCIDENPVQLSEWMKGRPEDLDRWYLVPCPKGQRCIIVASKGKTELYNKRGLFIRSCRTNLPGDQRAKHQVTILDCILDKKTKRIFVLDMMAYGSQEMANCETQFRFYWVTTKLTECDANVDSDLQLVPLSHYDMADESSVASCFERFPQFEDNSPELDGFLFYHKDASYTYGNTPLVLWLFAFMIPEVLGYNVHATYITTRPSEYVDYMHFMNQFDEVMLKKATKIMQRKERKKNHGKMDNDPEIGNECENGEMDGVECEEIEDECCELEEIIDHERRLEMEETA